MSNVPNDGTPTNVVCNDIHMAAGGQDWDIYNNGTSSIVATASVPAGWSCEDGTDLNSYIIRTPASQAVGSYTARGGLAGEIHSADFTVVAATVPSGVPAAPTLTGLSFSHSAFLEWTALIGALGYKLYRRLPGHTYGSPIRTTLSTVHSGGDGPLLNGQEYFYTVRAFNDSGDSLPSNEVSVTPADTTVPPAPHLDAVAGDNSVTLTITGGAGSTGSVRGGSSKIFRHAEGGSYNFAVPLVTITASTSETFPANEYVDATAANGNTYYYVARVVNSIGASSNSNEAQASPPGITGTSCPVGQHFNGIECVEGDDPTDCADGYHYDGTTCVPNVVTLPPAIPGEMRVTTFQRSVLCEMTTLPARADSLKVQRKIDGIWVAVSPALAGGASFLVIGLDPDTDYDLRPLAVNEVGVTSGPEAPVHTLLNPPADTAPNPPDTLAVTKDCAGDSLVIACPPFIDDLDNAIDTIEVERSSDDGTSWTPIHTFSPENGAAFEDASVLLWVAYSYRARACNVIGCSTWNDPSAAIALISARSTGVWLSPADGLNPAKRKLELIYQFTDTSGPTSEHQIYVNGNLLTTSKKLSGTLQNGTFHATWDTRHTIQGSATLTAQWRGSDGCRQRTQVTINLVNSRTTGVLYRDFWLGPVLSSGEEYYRAYPSLRLGKLSDAASARYYGQAVIITDDTISAVTDETSYEVAQTAFEAAQPAPLTRVRPWVAMGFTQPGTIRSTPNGLSLTHPGLAAILRVRQEPAIVTLPYDTGSERIVKLRKFNNDPSFLVLTQTPSKVFTYKTGQLQLRLNATSTYGFTDVVDAAFHRDKLYLISGGEVYAYDTDSSSPENQRLLLLKPFGETRPAVAVEVVGTTLYVLRSDESSTRCFSLEGDQHEPVWVLPVPTTKVWSNGSALFIASGTSLYETSGSAAPTLLNSVAFSSPITAIGPMAVGLEDGTIHILANGSWSSPAGSIPSDPVGAISVWFGELEGLHYIFGSLSAVLQEQDATGSWNDSFTLPNPTDYEATVLEVTQLERMVISTQTPVEAKPKDERLLVGTASSGLLYEVSESILANNPSAFLFSTVEDSTGTAVSRPVSA